MRTKHRWTVTLQANDGEVVEREVRAYWDPARDDTAEAIGLAAKAEAFAATRGQRTFSPIAAQLQAPEPIAA